MKSMIKSDKKSWPRKIINFLLIVCLCLGALYVSFCAGIYYKEGQMKTNSFLNRITTSYLISVLGNRDMQNLSLNEKFILYTSHYLSKNALSAVELLPEFEKEADTLKHDQLIAIALTSGKYFRAMKQYDQEFEVYDIFLKERVPITYHLFRADSYKERGNKIKYRTEMNSAKKITENPDLLPE